MSDSSEFQHPNPFSISKNSPSLATSVPLLPASFAASLSEISPYRVVQQFTELLFKNSFDDAALQLLSDRLNIIPLPIRELDSNIFVMEAFHGYSGSYNEFLAEALTVLIKKELSNSQSVHCICIPVSLLTALLPKLNWENVDRLRFYFAFGTSLPSELKVLQHYQGLVKLMPVSGSIESAELRMLADIETSKQQGAALPLENSNHLVVKALPILGILPIIAAQQIGKGEKIVLSLPADNLAALYGALLLKKMGFDGIERIILASNASTPLSDWMLTGKVNQEAFQRIPDNPMDTVQPFFLNHILELYNNDRVALAQDLLPIWFTDRDMYSAQTEVWEKYTYLSEPASSLSILGLEAIKDYLKKEVKGVALASASIEYNAAYMNRQLLNLLKDKKVAYIK